MSGKLAVVGIGPGDPGQMTVRARDALREASAVIAYEPYCEQIRAWWPDAPLEPWPIGAEPERAAEAARRARAGERLAVASGGDAGVYGMAPLVLDALYDLGWDGERDPELEIVPGVTAAVAAAARLGAPFGVDAVLLSLSDLLVPWDVVVRRLRAVAAGDLAVALYNPRSRGRPDALGAALALLGEGRDAGVPAALVHDAFRPGERVELTTLGGIDPARVGMSTLVVVGCSTTRRRGRHLVTSRPRRTTPED